jgi:hypothetical protein
MRSVRRTPLSLCSVLGRAPERLDEIDMGAHYGLVTQQPGHVRAGLAEISSRL